MALPKRPRIGIGIDMTPMVDIGFLLVIFFMCTYSARPPETVGVELPLSRSPFKVPESDIMIITVIPPDRAVAIADSINPTALLQTVAQYQASAEQGGLGFQKNRAIEKAVHEFKTPERYQQTVIETAPFTPEQRKARADSLLVWWNLGRSSSLPVPLSSLRYTLVDERTRNPRLRLVVKADKNVQSGFILQLMDILQDPQVNMLRFSMMTILEESPLTLVKAASPQAK